MSLYMHSWIFKYYICFQISMTIVAIADQNHFLTSPIVVIWIRTYTSKRTRYRSRSPYALRHGGVLCRERMAFENWSKLEVGYPVSSLICKLQEICGIGLARQQQRQHPPFYSLVARVCHMRLYSYMCVCVYPLFYIYLFRSPLSGSLGILAVIHSTRAVSLWKAE